MHCALPVIIIHTPRSAKVFQKGGQFFNNLNEISLT